ncbi:unnamed protein product [Arabidopsis arenosa]|uniref:Bulb-type lectin domain-containing protein n=1 Tax=Arabidopsis arenosa TaxID=38785 RepID=A0A8S1ZI12_ARAAE|nr:unnamed protein product [Arabidopsis arenosa]
MVVVGILGFGTSQSLRELMYGLLTETICFRLSKSIGTLKISYANIVLLDHYDTPVWSTNLTRMVKSPVVAELLDNGNFVESFLNSWRSPYDPSSGDFSFKPGTQGLPEFYLYMKEFLLYRSGPWNGVGFSGIPTMQNWSYFDDTYFNVTDHSMHYLRFTLTSEGLLQIFRWGTTSSKWNLFGVLPTEDCDLHQICSRDSYCDMKTLPTCNCIKGFVPKNVTAWALGDTFERCVRKSRLSCHGDAFF